MVSVLSSTPKHMLLKSRFSIKSTVQLRLNLPELRLSPKRTALQMFRLASFCFLQPPTEVSPFV